MDNPNIVDKKPMITELDADKNYAWCACGLSTKEGGAFCDGSHKNTNFSPHIFKPEKTAHRINTL